MRVNLTIVDDEGKTYGGRADLETVDLDPAQMETYGTRASDRAGIDLDLPVRPFMKRYGAAKSGPKRFVLLLAHLAHGSVGASIHVSDLQRVWNTMGGLIGGNFNSAYPTRAKDNGWVDTTKSGEYVLLPGWTEIL
jgi:hypothetical protein